MWIHNCKQWLKLVPDVYIGLHRWFVSVAWCWFTGCVCGAVCLLFGSFLGKTKTQINLHKLLKFQEVISPIAMYDLSVQQGKMKWGKKCKGVAIQLSTALSSALFRMSSWPYAVQLLATRGLYWGYVWLSTYPLPSQLHCSECQVGLM